MAGFRQSSGPLLAKKEQTPTTDIFSQIFVPCSPSSVIETISRRGLLDDSIHPRLRRINTSQFGLL